MHAYYVGSEVTSAMIVAACDAALTRRDDEARGDRPASLPQPARRRPCQ